MQVHAPGLSSEGSKTMRQQLRDPLGPPERDDAVIDLARQEPERQPDDAAGVTEHALDREVRLAGVGRPEDGANLAGGRT